MQGQTRLGVIPLGWLLGTRPGGINGPGAGRKSTLEVEGGIGLAGWLAEDHVFMTTRECQVESLPWN